MVNIVNEIGIDNGIVLALQSDLYDKGGADFSATDLINPPRISQLLSRHGSEIDTEAADLVYILLGRTTHEMLEKIKLTLAGENSHARNQEVLMVLESWEMGELTLEQLPTEIQKAIDRADKEKVLELHKRLIEKRLFTTITVDSGEFLLSGQIDEFDIPSGTLSDYKVCSVWSVMDKEPKIEWTQQLNIYAYLLRKNGYEVNLLKINAIFRDWSKSKAGFYYGYPTAQVASIEIPLWTNEEAEKFIEERLNLHAVCATLPDEVLPICSAEERWVRDNKFAVMKKGRARAIKLCDSADEAKGWIERNKREDEEMYIEKRDGSSVRCISYCPVVQFCEYGKFIVEKERKLQEIKDRQREEKK